MRALQKNDRYHHHPRIERNLRRFHRQHRHRCDRVACIESPKHESKRIQHVGHVVADELPKITEIQKCDSPFKEREEGRQKGYRAQRVGHREAKSLAHHPRNQEETADKQIEA